MLGATKSTSPIRIAEVIIALVDAVKFAFFEVVDDKLCIRARHCHTSCDC